MVDVVRIVGSDAYKREQREENQRLSEMADMLERTKAEFNSIGANMAAAMERERQLQRQLDWQAVAYLCGWDQV